MDKENKGLADSQEGDFILNESGTSVSIGIDKDGAFEQKSLATTSDN